MRVRWFRPTLVVLSLLSTSCAPRVGAPETAVMASAPVVRQSPLDDRQIATFVLPNGLRALVVSDPDTDMAAAAVDVHIGQFSDPWDRQGLAHFLEHMLFMGTEKYPEEDAYRKFIQDHGGRTNAGTGQTHTRYHFQVTQDQLEPALDRFAQFFIAPKLDPAYVERERNAVHAEYKLKVKDDARRIREVRRSTSNPAHPFAKFSVGNLDTLADREGDTVWEDLKALYDAAYSASRMTVVVVGREDVATLSQMVRSRFGLVASDGQPVVHTDVPPFLPEQLGVKVHIVPEEERRTLTLEFLTPPMAPNFRTKPEAYLAGLLGHEGEGTLYTYLKDKGWIEGLGTGMDGADDHGLFTATFRLTEAGFEHRDEVVDAFFAYVKLVGDEGITAERYDELRKLADLRFAFAETADAVSTVNGLSYALHQVPPEHAIDHGYLYERFDADLIRSLHAQLRPDNMRMLLVAPGLSTDQVEARYDAPYAVIPLTSAEHARWTSVDVPEALRLPDPNPYIAEDVSLDAPVADVTEPVRLLDTPQLELWHHPDVSFAVPKAMVRVEVFSEAPGHSDRDGILNVLYGQLLSDSLETFNYPLREAGVGFSLGEGSHGLTLGVSGYDDKQQVVLAELLRRVRAFRIDPARFEVVRERVLRSWRNATHARPISQASRRLTESMVRHALPATFGISVLEDLTVEELEAFIDRFHATLSARMLVHGNHDGAAARAMAEQVQATLLAEAGVADRGLVEVALLPPGRTLVRDLDIDHDDSSIIMYFQGTATSVEEAAPDVLLGQLLRTPFFTQLRTEQQLGYVVGMSYSRFDEVAGLKASIQSSVAGPVVLQERIEAFLHDFRTTLAQMPAEEFDTVRQGLIDDILEREERLSARSSRYARELSRGFVDFDSRERAAAALEAVTQAQVLDVLDRVVLSDERRLMIVRNTGHAHTADLPAEPGCAEEVCFADVLTERFARPR